MHYNFSKSTKCKLNIIRLASVVGMSSVQRKPFEHLSTSILPSNYALTLHPDLEKFTFTGEETIDIEVGNIFICLHNLSHFPTVYELNEFR